MGMSEHDRLKDKPPACPECGNRGSGKLVSSYSSKAPSKSWPPSIPEDRDDPRPGRAGAVEPHRQGRDREPLVARQLVQVAELLDLTVGLRAAQDVGLPQLVPVALLRLPDHDIERTVETPCVDSD